MNKQQLTELIQGVVKEEIKKIISPLLKKTIIPLIKETISKNLEKSIKNQVNEILNEKLLKVMSNRQTISDSPTSKKKYSLTEQSTTFEEDIDLEIGRQSQKKQLRENLKKKLIDDNPLMESIYGDIGEDEPSIHSHVGGPLPSGYQGEDGVYIDSDDEGVDLDFLDRKLS